MSKSRLSLTQLMPLERGLILQIDSPDSNVLSGFGLYPGVEIEMRQTFPGYVIKLDETELALEAVVASGIQVIRL